MAIEITKTTSITNKCDAKDCATVFSWDEKQLQNDPDTLPDGIYRFLILATFGTDSKWAFCSKACLLGFLKDLPVTKSPRQIKEEADAKAKAAEIVEKTITEGVASGAA